MLTKMQSGEQAVAEFLFPFPSAHPTAPPTIESFKTSIWRQARMGRKGGCLTCAFLTRSQNQIIQVAAGNLSPKAWPEAHGPKPNTEALLRSERQSTDIHIYKAVLLK